MQEARPGHKTQRGVCGVFATTKRDQQEMHAWMYTFVCVCPRLAVANVAMQDPRVDVDVTLSPNGQLNIDKWDVRGVPG